MHLAPRARTSQALFHAYHEVACRDGAFRVFGKSLDLWPRRHGCGGTREDQSLEESDQVMGHLLREPQASALLFSSPVYQQL
jgi:hypothetical protein